MAGTACGINMTESERKELLFIASLLETKVRCAEPSRAVLRDCVNHIREVVGRQAKRGRKLADASAKKHGRQMKRVGTKERIND